MAGRLSCNSTSQKKPAQRRRDIVGIMIPYEELVSALADWRTRQGLGPRNVDYLGTPAQHRIDTSTGLPPEMREHAVRPVTVGEHTRQRTTQPAPAPASAKTAGGRAAPPPPAPRGGAPKAAAGAAKGRSQSPFGDMPLANAAPASANSRFAATEYDYAAEAPYGAEPNELAELDAASFDGDLDNADYGYGASGYPGQPGAYPPTPPPPPQVPDGDFGYQDLPNPPEYAGGQGDYFEAMPDSGYGAHQSYHGMPQQGYGTPEYEDPATFAQLPPDPAQGGYAQQQQYYDPGFDVDVDEEDGATLMPGAPGTMGRPYGVDPNAYTQGVVPSEPVYDSMAAANEYAAEALQEQYGYESGYDQGAWPGDYQQQGYPQQPGYPPQGQPYPGYLPHADDDEDKK